MKKLFSLFAAVLFAGSMFAADPITCQEAADAARNGSTEEVTVQGYVTSIAVAWSSQYKNVSFWMADTQNGGNVLEAFRAKCENEADAPKVGDLVKATGNLKMYNSTPELDAGCTFEIIERAPEVELDTISVSEALQRITDNKLGACFIKGKVMKILTKAADIEKYGNINYWLGDIDNPNDSIQGYKMNGAENKKYTSAADIEFVESDEILVYAAALQLYHNNNTNQDIPEINVGYYVRTLKSSVIDLPWKFGTAYRGEGEWTLEITKANNDTKNVLEVAFASDKANSIKGSHSIEGSLTIEGAKADAAGTATLAYKAEEDGINVYDVQIFIQTADNMFSIKQDIQIFAVDEESEEIILDGDRPFKPTEDGQEITCAQAQEYAFSLAANAESELSVVVVGYVTDIYADGESFWMADTQGKDKVIQAYKFKTVTPAGVGLAVGAKVKLAGKLLHYVNSNNGQETAEVKNGAVTIVEGGEEIKADEEVTVAEALAIAQALEQNATSDKVYGITGFVASIVYPYDETKGISFWMSDDPEDRTSQDFEAYQVHCSPEIGAKIAEGSKVRVVAKVTHFHQDAKPAEGDQEAKEEKTVYETVKGGTVELADGSAVDNIYFDVPAVKLIENGQIIIIRNGVRYNVQGQIAQ